MPITGCPRCAPAKRSDYYGQLRRAHGIRLSGKFLAGGKIVEVPLGSTRNIAINTPVSSAVASKRWSNAIPPRERVRRGTSVPIYYSLLAALAGAILTVGAWYVASRAETELVERQAASTATAIESAIKDRLDAYISVLQAGAGLFDASDEVTFDDWRSFTRRLRESPIYPGTQGVGFAARVRQPSDLERYRIDQPVRLWPESSSAERTAVVYLEPLTSRNRAALGFDMMSETTRRIAMEHARDQNTPALSGKVSLKQEITEDKQAGFLLYVPVYAHLGPLKTVEERRAALLGFVYSPFRVEDFLRGVLGRTSTEVKLTVYDGPTPSADALLYGEQPLRAAHVQKRTVKLAGHEWTLLVEPAPTRSEHAHEDSRWILFGGALATLLVAASVFALAMGRQHARERLRVEHALLEGERFAAAVIENSLDAYISIDRNDRIVGWNRKAEEIFGWRAEEVSGLLLSETIVPVHLRARHLAAVQAASTEAGKLLGRRIEMPAIKRGGEEIVIELSILAVPRSDKPIFVASLRDITRQREQETQLRSLNENLEHAVGERTRALEQANAVLRSTNDQLDAFTRNVSHDLRAPLRAIEGYTRLAAEEGESTLTSNSRSHLRAVLRNVHRMQSIIDGLLKLAWIGQQPLRPQEVDLWKMVLDIVNELTADQTFVLRVQPHSLATVWADPALLEHALRNLLSNAAKFSRKATEPTVEVGMHTVKGEHHFFVRDNGVGFDPRYAEQLFQVFGRLHRTDEYEGTGIGLTIVRSVIERHGGRIWAESVPGLGATFWFTLPGVGADSPP